MKKNSIFFMVVVVAAAITLLFCFKTLDSIRINSIVVPDDIHTASTSIYFDLGNFKKQSTIVSPDGTKTAHITQDGKIFINDAITKRQTIIDALQGSTTVPGFSTPDYTQKKRLDNSYPSKAVYYGWVAFITNNQILYPVKQAESIIKDLNNGKEKNINGDVVQILENQYLIYTKYSQGSGSDDNHYILYNIGTNEGIDFYPDARGKHGILKNFSICKNKVSFIQIQNINPENPAKTTINYYTFSIVDKSLNKIGRSEGEQVSEKLMTELTSCK